MSAPDAAVCRDCGCLIGDSHAHRRWHRNVVTAKPVGQQPRFVGQGMPEPPDNYPPPPSNQEE